MLIYIYYKGNFPIKDKDLAMASAFAFLRSKGAFPVRLDSISVQYIFLYTIY